MKLDLVQLANKAVGMEVVNTHEAKTHLSRLIEDVQSGREIIIARAGKPVARLVRYEPDMPKRPLGIARGQVTIHETFDDPLPPDVAQAFGDTSS
ncbi:MAG: type II toxin-antitoxin system Phd/YefM family antitoxin [Planctomycetota bacterium]